MQQPEIMRTTLMLVTGMIAGLFFTVWLVSKVGPWQARSIVEKLVIVALVILLLMGLLRFLLAVM